VRGKLKRLAEWLSSDTLTNGIGLMISAFKVSTSVLIPAKEHKHDPVRVSPLLKIIDFYLQT